MLSYHKYTYFKNNARPSHTCISLCKHFKVSVLFFVFLWGFFVPSQTIGYSSGWSLNTEEGLYKNRTFSLESLEILSPKPKT